jgi:cytochrome P450
MDTRATAEGWDWDPRDASVQQDQVAGYDAAREAWSLARSDSMGWSVLRHEDALTVLQDPETFSSRVSTHVAVPNGMDPPEHTAYRAIVDRTFTPERVRSFEPELRALVQDLLATVTGDTEVEVMAAIGEPFAARAQCAYLGWPLETATALQDWAAGSARATASGDRLELARVAERFDRIIVGVLDRQRAAGPEAPATLTAALLDERIDGAPLSDATLVSMLRNWTAGELGTIAAAAGIIVAHLAQDQALQEELRADADRRQAAMDELLRLEAPLIANRRRTTRSVTLQGRAIPADAPVSILWPAVQRDPRAIPEPTRYRADRDPALNLLYGRGPHACPGEGLARLELGVLFDELFRVLPAFELVPGATPPRATYPSGGFTEVRIRPIGSISANLERSTGFASSMG